MAAARSGDANRAPGGLSLTGFGRFELSNEPRELDYVERIRQAATPEASEHALRELDQASSRPEWPWRCLDYALKEKQKLFRQRTGNARPGVEEQSWENTCLALDEQYPRILGLDNWQAPLESNRTPVHLLASHSCSRLLQALIDRHARSVLPLPDDDNVFLREDHDLRATALVSAINSLDPSTVRVLVRVEPQLLSYTSGREYDTPLHTLVRRVYQDTRPTRPNDVHEILHTLVNGRKELLYQCNFKTSPRPLANTPIHPVKDGSPYHLACDLIQNVSEGYRDVPPALAELRGRLRSLCYDKLRDNLQTLQQALYRDENEVKLLELNLEDFDMSDDAPRDCQFTRFVDTTFRPNRHTSSLFASELVRLRLPDMSRYRDDKSALAIHQFLLRLGTPEANGGFGITKIWDLRAWDHEAAPTNVNNIAQYLTLFKVEELNWYTIDLDIGMLQRYPRAIASMTKLCLYTRYNFGMLYHWTSQDGLVTFPNLTDVRITLIQSDGTEMDDLSTARADFLREFEDRWRETKREAGRTELDVSFAFGRPHKAQQKVMSTAKSFITEYFNPFERIHEYLGEIEPQISDQDIERSNIARIHRRIRVAVIDNGIDPWQSRITDNLIAGKSFEPGPWFTPSHSHGTHMAFLITLIYPFCQLVPYRISKEHHDIDAVKAAEAIRDAISRQVDVINISWSFDHEVQVLTDAINEAQSADPKVLVFCSDSDQPLANGAWPADCRSAIGVTAISQGGRRRVKAGRQHHSPQLLMLGESVPAFGPTYNLVEEVNINGSSVATALASGLAALMLRYAQIYALATEDWKRFKDKDQMLGIFEKMGFKKSPSSREIYVDPYMLFSKHFADGKPKPGYENIFQKPVD